MRGLGRKSSPKPASPQTWSFRSRYPPLNATRCGTRFTFRSVDRPRSESKMDSTCRPQRRHISFYRPFVAAGTQGRALPSSADLCPCRPRFRAGRGLLADCDQRRALSRLLVRRRGQCARPCASEAGRGADRPGPQALARLEPLPDPGSREARAEAVRGKLRRRRVLRQFRRRGDGSRDQDGAQISRRKRAPREGAHHHLRGRVPRPHAGDARGRRPAEISRRLRPGRRRLRPGARSAISTRSRPRSRRRPPRS